MTYSWANDMDECDLDEVLPCGRPTQLVKCCSMLREEIYEKNQKKKLNDQLTSSSTANPTPREDNLSSTTDSTTPRGADNVSSTADCTTRVPDSSSGSTTAKQVQDSVPTTNVNAQLSSAVTGPRPMWKDDKDKLVAAENWLKEEERYLPKRACPFDGEQEERQFSYRMWECFMRVGGPNKLRETWTQNPHYM